MAETSAPYTAKCPKCSGEKGYLQIINGHEYWQVCECYRREQEHKRLMQLFRSAKIPKRYAKKTLGNFDQSRQPKACSKVNAYLKNWEAMKHQGSGLIFVGDVGTGKTHLAFALLLDLLKDGVTGLAATVPDLMDDLRPRKNETSERQMEQIEALKTVDLLLLDDLGAQRESEWVTERLFIILNARYNSMLPTIITSNERLEYLESLKGWKRIVDRIIEVCGTVLMQGDSFRLEQAKAKS